MNKPPISFIHYEKVVFGVVDPAVRKQIPANIEVKLPVTNSELTEVLKDADILAIFYKDSAYIRGVIPEKLFECLATGKVLVISGLNEATPYSNVVYDIYGSVKKALETIRKLPETETTERLVRRDAVTRRQIGQSVSRFS